MKVRTLIAGIGAAAVVGSGGLLFTTAASAQSASHTLKFVTVESNAIDYSATAFAGTDEDYSTTSGALIGFAVLRFTVNPVSGKVKIDAAVDVDGGVIYGTLHGASSTAPIDTGTVTGGTGKYRNAAGTITAAAENATTSLVTVVFTT